MPTLTVCLLTRNEEATVGRAIGSISGLADQIVVAETGSTDRTAEIARTLGAEVVPFAWDDDFAAGRNFAIAQARGDWIFWLNADEELTPESRAPIAGLIARPGTFGYFVRLRNLTAPDHPERSGESADLRLFRRRPDLGYVGRLHPAFDPALVESIKREGEAVLPSELVLVRHAYLSEATEPKLRWTLRLLDRELAERPDQLRYQIERGRVLLALKDPAGHAALAEAAAALWADREAPGPPTRKAAMLLEYVLTTDPTLVTGPIGRDDAWRLTLQWFASCPPLLWAGAALFARGAQFNQAVPLLDRLLELGRTGTFDRDQAFDPGIVGPLAALELGRIYLAVGSPARALPPLQDARSDPRSRPEAERLLAQATAELKATGVTLA